MGFYANSATAASNTTVNSIGSAGTSDPANIDNLIRELAAQGRQFANDLGGNNTVSGTADAIVITPSSGSPGAYYDGLLIGFISGGDTTVTNPTGNVSSLGAKTIKKSVVGVETDLAVGDIQSGGFYLLRYRSSWASAAGAWELLDIAGGLSSFSSTITPATNDGAALGTSTLMWSDLFLASGAVVNWNNGDLALTHSSNFLTLTGGQVAMFQNIGAASSSLALHNQTDNASVRVLSLNGDRATMANNDAAYVSMLLSDSAGNQDEFARFTWQATDVTSTSEDGAIITGIAIAGTVTTISKQDENGLSVERGSLRRGAPVTKTGDFTVDVSENWIIVNKGSTCTVTLPTASSFTGREIMISVITAHTVVSASSNVVPRTGGAAGTAILAATDGAWATLVSDGTNWICMQGN